MGRIRDNNKTHSHTRIRLVRKATRYEAATPFHIAKRKQSQIQSCEKKDFRWWVEQRPKAGVRRYYYYILCKEHSPVSTVDYDYAMLYAQSREKSGTAAVELRARNRRRLS